MRCPNCDRDFGDVSSFPVTCSCLAKVGKDGALIHRATKPIPSRISPTIPVPEPVGTNLASLIPEWAKSMKGGCSCRDWEVKMNRWRVDGCEAHREQIIDHLMNQSEHLVKPLQHLPAALKRAVAGKMLDKAIKMSRQK
jgi:hypothetical protein